MKASRLGPIRFLWLVVGGWVLMRAGIGLLSGWPATAEMEAIEQIVAKAQVVVMAAITPPVQAETPVMIAAAKPAVRRAPRHVDMPGAIVTPTATTVRETVSEAPPTPTLALPPLPVAEPSPHRWHGSAWLFARDGGGVDLARFGQLGGSQAGARIAWRVDGSGRIPVSIAGRAYAPLSTRKGAEGAIGIEVEPIRHAALRLSVERRFGVTRGGRDAWSAYAAGGVYREFGQGIVADAYAQAGVVGARRRDLFADGALRAGRRLRLGETHAVIIGAGAWGAAQPGAKRLDMGPRVAIVVPVDRTTVTLASEYRIRVAGDARPGSGLALTLAADF